MDDLTTKFAPNATNAKGNLICKPFMMLQIKKSTVQVLGNIEFIVYSEFFCSTFLYYYKKLTGYFLAWAQIGGYFK